MGSEVIRLSSYFNAGTSFPAMDEKNMCHLKTWVSIHPNGQE